MINYAVGDCTSTSFSLDLIGLIFTVNISIVLGLIFSRRLARHALPNIHYQFVITVLIWRWSVCLKADFAWKGYTNNHDIWCFKIKCVSKPRKMFSYQNEMEIGRQNDLAREKKQRLKNITCYFWLGWSFEDSLRDYLGATNYKTFLISLWIT